ncbi:hypothetical protein ACH46_14745 [Gordonia phthalatica]|uniref:Uncharacterized protein n=2 Tax=Gordonia phthalatica TaxID=1136941 RepID=A0A0N9N3X3_9ACTN|nr:hypothetical protein ACH46_14745 [Gordonia phthalatica]
MAIAVAMVVSGCDSGTAGSGDTTALDLGRDCLAKEAPTLDLQKPLRERWHVKASAIVPEWQVVDTVSLIDINPDSDRNASPATTTRPILCGHTFVVVAPSILGEQPAEQQTIAGIDVSTGSVAWRAPLAAHAKCAQMGERFGCVATLPDHVSVQVFSPVGGDTHEYRLPAADAAVPVSDGIVTAIADGDRTRITKYSADGQAWSSTTPVGPSTSRHDDLVLQTVGADFAIVHRTYGRSAAVFATRTGKVVAEVPSRASNFAVSAFPGRRVIANAADGAVIVDESGRTVRRHPGAGLGDAQGWPHLQSAAAGAQVYALQDGLYDVETGQKSPIPQQLRIPGQPPSPPYTAILGPVIGRTAWYTAQPTNSYASLADPRTAGVDTVTGRVRWVRPARTLGSSAGPIIGTTTLLVDTVGNRTMLSAVAAGTARALWSQRLGPGDVSPVETRGAFDIDVHGVNLTQYGISLWGAR